MTSTAAPNGFLGILDNTHFNTYVQNVIDGDILSNVTVAIGGSPLASFTNATSNNTVSGATTSMVAVCSPTSYPGDNVDWRAYVVAANTVKVVVTNSSNATVTPSSSTYQIRVFK